MLKATSIQCSRQAVGAANPRFWEIGEYNAAFNELLEFLKVTLSTEQLPFEISHAGAIKHVAPRDVRIHGTYSLDYYFYVMRDFQSIVIPGYSYSPLLDLFHICLQRHSWLRYCEFRNPSAYLSVVPALEAEVFNDFVQMLRTQARKRNTVWRMRKWASNTESSQAGAIGEYVAELLHDGDGVEPIRLDGQFHESVFSLSDAMPYYQWIIDDSQKWACMPLDATCPSEHPESRARIDSRIAMQDRERFFANFYRGRDKQTLRYIRGYIAKMERGRDGAYHFHFCFFLKAKRPAHLTTDVVIDVLARRWVRVTGGRGFIFNCHNPAYRQKLKRQGRWVLDRLTGDDGYRVKRLTDYLVSYFARDKNQSIHIKPTARSRVLTMAVGRVGT